MKITLSNKTVVEVPEGADPARFRRIEEARLKKMANPTKSKRQSQRCDTGRSKRSRYAAMQAVLSGATLELVKRVNGDTDE